MEKSIALFLVTIIVALFFMISCVSANSKKPTRKIENSSIVLEGIVKEIKVSAGTLSEYSYYVLNTGRKEETILFNSKSFSGGFDIYVGKKVRVRGKMGSGFIGWRKTKREGLLVKEISEMK